MMKLMKILTARVSIKASAAIMETDARNCLMIINSVSSNAVRNKIRSRKYSLLDWHFQRNE